MKITMLGTGAAFVDPDRAQSGVLVTLDNGCHYLFDCGAGIVRNMVRANVNPADVPFVFLTHLHHNHICDFALFTITGWMWARQGSPIVVGPKGTQQFCARLFEGGAFHSDFSARSHYPARKKNREAMRPDVRECSPGIALPGQTRHDPLRLGGAHSEGDLEMLRGAPGSGQAALPG